MPKGQQVKPDGAEREIMENSSKGEVIIYNYLTDKKYKFVQNKCFGSYFDYVDSEVKTKRPDFIVFDEADNPIAVIEFDGTQHFSSSHWYNKRKHIYLECIEADDRKTKFCERRKIPLLRIRYDQIDKTGRVLDRFFKNPTKYTRRHNPYLSNKKYYEKREAA